MLEDEGKAGLSISKHDNHLAPFKLVSRGIDSSKEVFVQKIIKETKFPFSINFSSEKAIKFCPWCGTNLLKFNETNHDVNNEDC